MYDCINGCTTCTTGYILTSTGQCNLTTSTWPPPIVNTTTNTTTTNTTNNTVNITNTTSNITINTNISTNTTNNITNITTNTTNNITNNSIITLPIHILPIPIPIPPNTQNITTISHICDYKC